VAEESRQGQAENVIGYFLGNLRSQLVAIGRLSILKDGADMAADYFMAVPADQLSDEELFRRTEQMRLLGLVRRDLGDMDAALASFQDSYALSEDLLERDSTNATWILGLATSHYYLGEVPYLRGDPAAALEHWKVYLDLAEMLVEAEPENLTYQLEQSYAHGNVGSALEQMGDVDGALAEFLVTLEQKKRLAEQQPENAEFRSALATAYNKVAVAQRRLGDLEPALRHHRAELEVRQELVADDSSDMPARRFLSLAHTFLGELLMATGDSPGALEQRLAAWRLQQELVRWDSANVTWQAGLAVSARLAGLGMVAAGREEEGMAALLDSRNILLRLLDRDAASVDYRQELARTESALAVAHLDDRPDEAAAAARRSLEVLTPLNASGGGDSYAAWVESGAYVELGRSLAALGRTAEAREAWTNALSLLQSVAKDGGDIDHLATQASTLLHLGRVEEARPIAETLMRRGYRQAEFLALARRNGLLASRTR
jgi:tetratricopeptide (TPR) repeat protein